MAVHPRLDLDYIDIRIDLSAVPINQDLTGVEHWIDLTAEDFTDGVDEFDPDQFDLTEFD